MWEVYPHLRPWILDFAFMHSWRQSQSPETMCMHSWAFTEKQHKKWIGCFLAERGISVIFISRPPDWLTVRPQADVRRAKCTFRHFLSQCTASHMNISWTWTFIMFSKIWRRIWNQKIPQNSATPHYKNEKKAYSKLWILKIMKKCTHVGLVLIINILVVYN